MNLSTSKQTAMHLAAAVFLGLLAAAPAAQARAPRVEAPINLPEGTAVTLVLERPLSSEYNKVGDPFTMFIAQPVKVGGRTVLEPGMKVEGHVTVAHRCGRLARRGRLAVELDDLQVRGRSIVLKPLHKASDPSESQFHRVMHNITAPVREVTGNFTAGLGDTSPDQNFLPPHPNHDTKLAQDIVETDPFDAVEFGGPVASQLAHRGLVAAERVATNAAAFMLEGGPFGLLRRGATVDVPAGAVLHAVVAGGDAHP